VHLIPLSDEFAAVPRWVTSTSSVTRRKKVMAQFSKWLAIVVLPCLVSVGAAQAHDIEVIRGKVKSVEINKVEFVLTDQNDKEAHFRMGDNAAIHPGEKALVEEFLLPDGNVDLGSFLEVTFGLKKLRHGPDMEVASLQPGDEVIVTYIQGCKQATALEVCIGRMVLQRR
jgi:hypothetical protein